MSEETIIQAIAGVSQKIDSIIESLSAKADKDDIAQLKALIKKGFEATDEGFKLLAKCIENPNQKYSIEEWNEKDSNLREYYVWAEKGFAHILQPL